MTNAPPPSDANRRDPASQAQVDAADPANSTWLSANAGSGKTRVLTDRVARLLLGGLQPQRILCLTYTKAAASEMQNRLFARLGEWAMLPEQKLRKAVSDLGIEGAITAVQLAAARRLFARAIEAPGGLKIQTIHSFCASLLRRFPLEAGVSPQFSEMDERAAKILQSEIVDAMADGPDAGLVADVARYLTDQDFLSLTADICKHRSRFSQPLDQASACAMFDLPPHMDMLTLLSEVFTGQEPALFGNLIPVLQTGGVTDQALAQSLLQCLPWQGDLAALRVLEDALLFKDTAATPFGAKIGKVPTKAKRAELAEHMPALEALMTRIADARIHRVALAAVDKTLCLHRFAGAFLPKYNAAKSARGWLDFDDLILNARALLTDPSVAQWVLFRLDGGIDHILLDEAQDTSPDQWAVIAALAQEFSAGVSAREDPRTIFVVGDKKQSIYSFQGADLDAFDRMQQAFGQQLRGVGQDLADRRLEYSFRSSQAILGLVDATFASEAGQGLGGRVHHESRKPDLPGRVDLWPVCAPSPKPEDGAWYDPVDIVHDEHPAARLARQIAAQIRQLIDQPTWIPDDKALDNNEGSVRRFTAGDVLILVRRRSDIFAEIIRACKQQGLPIAGADRLKVGAELAVRDIQAVLSFLATPEDDLSLAAALRSPLLGWSEAQLYALAQPRPAGQYLWEALRHHAPCPPETLQLLQDLRDRADFLRPYELIERLLTRHRGRARLRARLGAEVEEGIDALLAQAMAYERSAVPSLTGFLGWLASDELQIKRQIDANGGLIRVMTVHGAKGLEAPLVILPDTAQRKAKSNPDLMTLESGQVAWSMPSAQTPAALQSAQDTLRARADAEDMRLLYVALTRAKTWAIICAAGDTGPQGEGRCWYDLVAQGIDRCALPKTQLQSPEGPVVRMVHGQWPEPDLAAVPCPDPKENTPHESPVLPTWLFSPAARPPRTAQPLSPSDLGGAKTLTPVARVTGQNPEHTATDQGAALLRGTYLHRLLEHFPNWPEGHWPDIAHQLLRSAPSSPDTAALLTPADIADFLEQARALLTAPNLMPLLRPTPTTTALSEVDLSAHLPLFAGQMLRGTIDRLLIFPDYVLAIDFKSNTQTPATPQDVPVGFLRQMGAYHAALSCIYPTKRIDTAILWTRTAQLMALPSLSIMDALQNAAGERRSLDAAPPAS